MSEKIHEVKDDATVKEFLKAGYSNEEIEGMSDEEFVYTAVKLVREEGEREGIK